MISDFELLYANAAQFDVATATPEISTNVYDSGPLATGNLGVDFGTGEVMTGHVIVTTTFVGATATLKVEFISAENTALTTNVVVHWTSALVPVASLLGPTAALPGYHLQFDLPPGDTYKRYTGFRMTAGTANFTAGNLTLLVNRGAEVIHFYASGQNFV